MMTRKRYIKLMMTAGWTRNEAEKTTGFNPPRTHDSCGTNTKIWYGTQERRRKFAMAYRGSWPYSTYQRAYDNYTALQHMDHGTQPDTGTHKSF